MPGGRPLKFQSVEEMQEMIDAYFEKCDAEEEPYTITGLAIALGATSRQTIINYEKRDEFFDTIKSAKLRVENYAEKQALTKNSAGAIFVLKNHGWTDKQEIDQTVQGGEKPVSIIIEGVSPDKA